MTKYEEKFIGSRIIVHDSHTTETLYTSLFTRIGTFSDSSNSLTKLLTGLFSYSSLRCLFSKHHRRSRTSPSHFPFFSAQSPEAFNTEGGVAFQQPSYEEKCQYFPENGNGSCVQVLQLEAIPNPHTTGPPAVQFTGTLTLAWTGKLVPWATVTVADTTATGNSGLRRAGSSTGLTLAMVPVTVAFVSMLLGVGLVVVGYL